MRKGAVAAPNPDSADLDMLWTMDGLPVERILEIAAPHGVSDVRFGSRARGAARPDSDLDLLVRPGLDTTLLTMAALKRELEETLGISVEVATERSIRPSHRDRVISEAKPLLAA